MRLNVRQIAVAATIGMLLLLGGCGGGGGGGSSTASSPNAQAVTVDNFSGNVNLLYTTVTVCAPGSGNCQAIDHVLVDTGSYGLRIMASVLSVPLPQAQIAGVPLGECGQFASGHTWGAVKTADVRMAEETASAIPVQVIGDGAFPVVPAGCLSSGPPIGSVGQLGAKGILGIGVFSEDCGLSCAQNIGFDVYFACTGAACSETMVPLVQQIQNPVKHFAVNNNGTVISLPSISASGAPRATGTLTFGIGTQSNNGLGGAGIQDVDPNIGTFYTSVAGLGNYPNSFIDSGSNGLFFDGPLPICADWYCPVSTQTYSATNLIATGSIGVTFRVANASSLFSSGFNYAFSNLAGTVNAAGVFDWGLPFFYGRSVFTAIEGQSTPAGPGPYFAY